MSMRTFIAVGLVGLSAVAFGRGESWVPAPPKAPTVETLTNADLYIAWKWRTDVTDPSTGVDAATAATRVNELAAELEPQEPWCCVKAKLYAYLCDNLSIGVSGHDWFPAFAVWNRYARPLRPVVEARNGRIFAKYNPIEGAKMEAGNASGKWTFWKDFDHSVPEWEKNLTLGFPGMDRRLRENWKYEPRYRAVSEVSQATLRLIDRFIAQGMQEVEKRGGGGDEGGGGDGVARKRLVKQVESLKRLRVGPPQTAHDAMMFIYLYFFCSEHFDVIQCRSLSIIDVVLWPYYRADLAAGRTTEAEFREQFKHFLWQWGSVDNYWGQPVTMGGTKADGTTEYNPLSAIILDVVDECALPTPKFHLKIADNTPRDIFFKALDMVRRHRSISFVGEAPIRRILTHYGCTEDEARRFYTKGCYEFCCPEGANGTGTGYVSLVKPIEELMASAAAGTFAPETYADFERAYLAAVTTNMVEATEIAAAFEQHLDDVNPANLSTLGVENAVKTGKDAFANGSARGNNTSILTVGLGTAVDALLAVREIVYENGKGKSEKGKWGRTLRELGEILARNWEGHEALRLRMLRSKRKWGTNDSEANATAVRISKALSAAVNGKPNSRGGQFFVSGHCARQFVLQGQRMGATPDGRKAGDEVSKNLSATMGADTEGVTALVSALGAMDSLDWPGDFPLDVMLLPYTVSGEKGLEAMASLVHEYFRLGGTVIQFNIFDADELRDAQAHPEKYENLQVRVCGWNVRWNDLPRVEQDAYIRRAEEIAR